jgi:transposase
MPTIIGLDLVKLVFQVHGVDDAGKSLLRKRLLRSEVVWFFVALSPYLVGIEACGSGHRWPRELRLFGHDVRLMPPQYVRPYVKTNSMMLPMPRRSAKRCSAPVCVSCRSRRQISRPR